MENQIDFIQIERNNAEHCQEAQRLWIPFIRELRLHEGTHQTDEEILTGLQKRIAIQGSRADMHFDHDGARKMYVCPDAVTGKPFWEANGYKDSGKFDPDDHKPIYIKRLPKPEDYLGGKIS